MHGVQFLYVILAVAFVVPIFVLFRTRLIRLDARVEVPPEDPPIAAQASLVSVPPAAWSVSDRASAGDVPLPIRAASLQPLPLASVRPVTISDGSPKPRLIALPEAGLPVPLRRSFSNRPPRPSTEDASETALPMPVRPDFASDRGEGS